LAQPAAAGSAARGFDHSVDCTHPVSTSVTLEEKEKTMKSKSSDSIGAEVLGADGDTINAIPAERDVGRRADRRPTRRAPRFFSVAEVAEILNVCERTVRRWIDRGKLIAHDLDGIVRIAESDLSAFIAARRRNEWLS
jgi:excisionase family DNA binding protein